jgi:hypothetical protein
MNATNVQTQWGKVLLVLAAVATAMGFAISTAAPAKASDITPNTSNPSAVWLLPASFDSSYSASQIQAVVGTNQQSMFPQSKIDGIGLIPCGRWAQLDWYSGPWGWLGDTLEWVNGHPEDSSIYVNHSWVYGGDCTTTTTTTTSTTSTTTTSTTTTTSPPQCPERWGWSDVQQTCVIVECDAGYTPNIALDGCDPVTTTTTTTPTTTTAPPVDVCPNIQGDQATVPEGYILADGECLQDVTLGVSSTDTPTPTLTEVTLAATGAGGTTGGVALALALVLGGLGVTLLRRKVDTEI